MERTSTAVFGWWRAAEVPGWSVTELTVGDATLAWEVDEQLAAVEAVLRLARAGSQPAVISGAVRAGWPRSTP